MTSDTALSRVGPVAVGAVFGVALAGAAAVALQALPRLFTPQQQGAQPLLNLRFDRTVAAVVNGVSGTYVPDYSPYGHHALVEGAPVILPTGGMEFRSTRADRLVIADDIALNPQEVTLEMVVRPRTYTPEANPGWANSMGLAKYHDCYELAWNVDKRFIVMVTDMVGNFRWARTNTEIQLDTLYHVVASYSLTRPLRIYLNGLGEYGYAQFTNPTGVELRKERSDLMVGDHSDKKYCDGTFYLAREWPGPATDQDVENLWRDARASFPELEPIPANWPAA